jgi:2-amino-4-hydroxy-6-hydroxymethyldihydropteridine diphosphokinase
MDSHEVYLGLGSNLGDGRANLERAISLIDERVGPVTRRSSFLTSEPWGFQSSHLFTNAVVLCVTECSPREVLRLTQQIERDLGRTAKTRSRAYADRPIDIDILLYDDIQLSTPELTIPHPLMHKRDFVMIPLKEVKAPYNPPAGDRGRDELLSEGEKKRRRDELLSEGEKKEKRVFQRKNKAASRLFD